MRAIISEEVFSRVRQKRLVATVVIDDIDTTLPLAHTLLDAGIGCIELTLRTDYAIEAIKMIRRKIPEMLVGAGTVLTADQIQMVKDVGGHFAVSPGLNRSVLEKSLDAGLPFAPGVCTPSEIECALSYNQRYLKFFPSEFLGGTKYLECIAAPYTHKGISFIPFGGINESNFLKYLEQDCVFAVGGSWLVPRRKVFEGDWTYIKKCCELAVNKIRAVNKIPINSVILSKQHVKKEEIESV